MLPVFTCTRIQTSSRPLPKLKRWEKEAPNHVFHSMHHPSHDLQASESLWLTIRTRSHIGSPPPRYQDPEQSQTGPAALRVGGIRDSSGAWESHVCPKRSRKWAWSWLICGHPRQVIQGSFFALFKGSNFWELYLQRQPQEHEESFTAHSRYSEVLWSLSSEPVG